MEPGAGELNNITLWMKGKQRSNRGRLTTDVQRGSREEISASRKTLVKMKLRVPGQKGEVFLKRFGKQLPGSGGSGRQAE